MFSRSFTKIFVPRLNCGRAANIALIIQCPLQGIVRERYISSTVYCVKGVLRSHGQYFP